MAQITSSYISSTQAFAQSPITQWPTDTRPLYSGPLTAEALRQVGGRKPVRVGQPRFDPYTRLLHRLFEPLILLSVLGVTRGAHSTTTQRDAGPNDKARRRLLQNLSYMCDFDKGGPSTTSIGLEEQEDRYNFWVSSNKAFAEKIVSFLDSIIEYLRDMTKMETKPTEDTVRTLVNKSIIFAKKRITKESRLFSQAINRCFKYLDPETSPTDRQLENWLKTFAELDHVKLCYKAYEDRQSKEALLLERDGPILSRVYHQSEATKAFGDAKHYLGRLAHHIRAPTQVISDALEVSSLLETCSVKRIPTISGAVRPNADDQIHLRGILKRMLSQADENKFSELSNSLEAMDVTLDLTKKIKEEYAKEDFQPIVHCEIQVLEHFYRNQLVYADNDRYIGCSKPACFCCHLYIQHHLARCIVPDSHQKIYLNWSPPTLGLDARNSKSPAFIEQRNLITKMLDTIRPEALDQIRKKAGPRTWHPDSLTGITSIERVLSQLDIGSLGLRERGYFNYGKGVKRPGALSTSSTAAIKIDLLPRMVNQYGKQDKDAGDESDDSDGGASI